MIKAVIFDIGGVLVEPPSVSMYRYYANHLKIKEDEFQRAYFKVENDWQTGKLTEHEFWKKIGKEIKRDFPVVDSLWLKGFKSTYREQPEILKIVKELKVKGHRTAILSNTETPIAEHFKKNPFRHFDLCVYSCEVGLRKPDVAIYQHALQKLGVKPHESIFIDDKRENIKGAHRAGMKTIHFVKSEHLINDLARLME